MDSLDKALASSEIYEIEKMLRGARMNKYLRLRLEYHILKLKYIMKID